MKHDTQTTASDICDALGRKIIAQKLGVGITAVSNASVQGRFSARWYVAIKSLCADAGIDCPDELFSFIHVGAPQTQTRAAQ